MLGHVLAEQVVRVEEVAFASLSLAVEVVGALAATAPLGMPSGKSGHHPGWKPLQGCPGSRRAVIPTGLALKYMVSIMYKIIILYV